MAGTGISAPIQKAMATYSMYKFLEKPSNEYAASRNGEMGMQEQQNTTFANKKNNYKWYFKNNPVNPRPPSFYLPIKTNKQRKTTKINTPIIQFVNVE